jgi:hypothetical protein
MRYVEGETLAQRLARESPLACDFCLTFFEKVARVLHRAHEAGLVHRDVKPANLMITEEGDPVLLDFGLVRELEDADEPLTESGQVLGTPAYLAPEQIRSSRFRVDRRSDLYSLGVCLYESLTGRRPFAADGREALYRLILQGKSADPRASNESIPKDLSVILAKAMALERADRYGSAEEFAEELRRCRELRPIEARPAGVLLRTRRFAQRNRALTVAVAASFVVGMIALLAVLFAIQRARYSEAVARDAYMEQQQARVHAERLFQQQMEDVALLADQKRLTNLQEEASQLWPARPEIVAALESWLEEASHLVEGANAHRQKLQQLRDRSGEEPTTEEAWWLDVLTEHLTQIETLEAPQGGLVTEVRSRLQQAKTAHQRSLLDHRKEWQACCEAIAADPRYAQLKMQPQLGLVPLGVDPRSKLWEFAVLDTGGIPQRDAQGKLPTSEESAVVLVLIPPQEQPALPAFLLSKHALTTSQWLRLAGRPADAEVEAPSTAEVHEVLRRHDLQLPTEAQWEAVQRVPGQASQGPPSGMPVAIRPARDLEG